MQTFKLNTLIYETAAAPFLATRYLIELSNHMPEISKIIRKDFYIDALLTGAKTIEQAIDIRRKVSQVLETTGFQLQKWAFNERTIIQDIPKKNQNLNSIDFSDNSKTKTLDVTWPAVSDNLQSENFHKQE